MFKRRKTNNGAAIHELTKSQAVANDSDEKILRALEKRGEALRRWRILAGLSRRELAEAVERHQNTLVAWEQGSPIDHQALLKLAALGFDIKVDFNGQAD